MIYKKMEKVLFIRTFIRNENIFWGENKLMGKWDR